MKNTYVTPEVEVIAAGTLEVLSGSVAIGDVDVNVGEGFF